MTNLSSSIEKEKLLAELLAKLDAQRKNIAKGKLFGDSTADIGKSLWGEPWKMPVNEHPRLLLRKENLPLIRKSLEESNPTNERFLSLVNAFAVNDSILPDVSVHGTNATVGGANIHNFESAPLEIIQVKALSYLIYGEELYGYQAVYYLKNFLLTLNIQQIASDQCRHYGFLMVTAALVYDWCYPLLLDEDKQQLIAAVENRICRMKNEMTKKEGQVVLEVGFPPAGQGAVVGHGSERQILRDYLSFATAIYGDNDSWWNYIAGRVYNDYVPPRNYYYPSGVCPQGPFYGTGRHISDLFSAWILKVATGENPYVGMENVVRGFLGYEYTEDMLYSDGDGHAGDGLSAKSFASLSYIVAYLYGDAAMLAWAERLSADEPFGDSMARLTSAMFVALKGLCELEPAADRYENMELIQYNKAPLGQYIIRKSRTDKASPSVFMRIKERSTGNHEHGDTGTFEIFYKEMLTNKGGRYNNYGHPQTAYYYRATISHNGIIVFNPSKLDFESEDNLVKWYSGSQIRRGEPRNLDVLMKPDYDMAEVTGRQHGYADSEKSQPVYAYIAGDISKAYYTDTASYVGRRMLTVYTENKELPMAFFVYDDVESAEPEFEKRFLLQITSSEEPTVEGNTVITERSVARLVLTSLSEDVVFKKVGGRNEGDYSSAASNNYNVNGHQCPSRNDAADDGHWGRVEIIAAANKKRAEFMNVLYVTDKNSCAKPEIHAISGEGVTGGVFDNKIAAVFATSRQRTTEELRVSVKGKCSLSYYVSGVAAGEWEVTVNGALVGIFNATAEGGLLTFDAPAGEIVISPVK